MNLLLSERAELVILDPNLVSSERILPPGSRQLAELESDQTGWPSPMSIAFFVPFRFGTPCKSLAEAAASGGTEI
jgi:hypothetical protein